MVFPPPSLREKDGDKLFTWTCFPSFLPLDWSKRRGNIQNGLLWKVQSVGFIRWRCEVCGTCRNIAMVELSHYE